MAFFIGMAIVMGMVFGGYILAGGKMSIIIKALPFELMMIGGAALGAFIITNKGEVMKKTAKDFKLMLSGTKWKKSDYTDLLCLMFTLTKIMKTKGMIEIEKHIENPHESEVFGRYPKIQRDHFAVDFIADTLRQLSMGLVDPYQVEDMMNIQLEKHHHEAASPAHSMQTVADALPALGIVAAVLGVIKTMASIDQPPEILGKMIGGALVGTFLGVFMAYCIAGPMSGRLGQIYDEDHHFYLIIRDIILAHLKGNAPQISVEIGRGGVPSHMQPTFTELEDAVGDITV